MRYVTAKKDKAAAYGIRTAGRRVKGKEIILNEKEVLVSTRLSGTLEERAAKLGGKVYTATEIKYKITQEGYKYGN